MRGFGHRGRAGVGCLVLALCGLGCLSGRAGDVARTSSGRLLLLDRGMGLGEGRHRLCVTQEPGARVIAEVWPPEEAVEGSAALFEVHARGHASLRRLPGMGREDEAVVLCRVMDPARADPLLGNSGERQPVEGTWRVLSRGSDGSVHRLRWEWWSDGRELAGRFDQDTDFRFAHMVRGTNGGGRVAFAVEYIQDRYDVVGGATATGWAGTWTKRGEPDAGTWTAERGDGKRRVVRDLDARRAEPLRAWTREVDGACWVGLGNDRPPGAGWGEAVVLGKAWLHGGTPSGTGGRSHGPLSEGAWAWGPAHPPWPGFSTAARLLVTPARFRTTQRYWLPMSQREVGGVV